MVCEGRPDGDGDGLRGEEEAMEWKMDAANPVKGPYLIGS